MGMPSAAPTTRLADPGRRTRSLGCCWIAHDVIDQANAAAVEAWVDDDALEVATQLLCVPEASNTEMFLMCSPPNKDPRSVQLAP